MIENKRIAYNTIALYVRMILTMAIALYMSRVALKVLGVSDYGIYNVVGGVVSMFAFINGALSAGTSRFIAYELGIGNKEKLRETFNAALISHIGLATIVILAAETIGLWFINTQLVFPENRTFAVNIVYQLSLITLVLQFTQIPYTATIIAHEKLNIYAYLSILEVSLKLITIFILSYNKTIDNLILYAALLFAIQVCSLCIYRIFCYKKFPESRWKVCKNRSLYKHIFSFSGWDILGAICIISQGQGVNVLLNIYFGPIVNAARAVSYQVEGAFSQLTGNFMTAINPQIVKSFANNEYTDMIELIKDGSKYGFYLLAIFLFPIMFKINYILKLWLTNVPDDTNLFILIILTNSMIRVIARPIIMGIHATGHIKRLNLYAGSIGLLPLPIIYILFILGFDAQFAFWTILLFGIIANIIEIIILKIELPVFNVKKYCIEVYSRCIIIGIIIYISNHFISIYFNDKFITFCIYFTICIILNLTIILLLGFNKSKREKIVHLITSKICKREH